jgi:hypothetical protein
MGNGPMAMPAITGNVKTFFIIVLQFSLGVLTQQEND